MVIIGATPAPSVAVQGELTIVEEEDVTMNNEKYRMILENMTSGISVFHYVNAADDFTITEFNAAASKISGISREEAVGECLGNIFPDLKKKGLFSALKRVYMTGKAEEYHTRAFRNARISLWITHSLFRISTGDVVSVFNDVTERKLTEQTLHDSERKLRAITHGSPLGLCLVKNRRFEWVNDTLCKLTGYDAKALIDQSARLFYMDDLEYERIRKELYADSRKNQLVTAVTQWRRKDGSVLNCSIRKSPLDVNDFSNGYIVAVADISERVQFEKDKERLETLLLHAQKMEALGVLAGGIAHDFNNILFPIMGYTELMMMDADNPRTKDYLEGIHSAVRRSKELIDQILTFSRQRIGREEPMKLQPVVKEIIKLLKGTFPSNIRIVHNIDKNCGTVMGEPSQIYQVVMNLCVNAFHAMESKGGKLSLSLGPIAIDADQAANLFPIEPGLFLMLEVKDTGEGIEPNIRKKIFDPYFTTKKPGKGSGIGLSLVHAIIKKAKGTIQVESTPGKGTCFRVFLPVVFPDGKTDKDGCRYSSTCNLQGKGRILLVDDEKEIVLLLEKILTRHGYHVTGCMNGMNALKIFAESPFRFDLIITDLTMPEMTGIELSEALNKIRSDIPIMMCTGFCENVPIKTLKKKRILSAVVRKPVVMSELLEEISKTMINKEIEVTPSPVESLEVV